MRSRFHEARDQLISKYGIEALKTGASSTERFQVEMYLDYWYAGIFAAMEGYEKLGLADAHVDGLRADALYTKLRAYRAGTYHFREKYFDDDIRAFLREERSASWLVNIDTCRLRWLIIRAASLRRSRPGPIRFHCGRCKTAGMNTIGRESRVVLVTRW